MEEQETGIGLTDPTEATRRDMIESGQVAQEAAMAEGAGEQTWDTTQFQQDFDVIGFMAPFVAVVRKADNQKGTLEFRHSPRVYFGFSAS